MNDHTEHGSEPHAHERHRLSPYARRSEAIAALLIEKGMLTKEELRREMETMARRSPADGARLVARAWVDPAFKSRLAANPKAAAAELGIDATSYAELVIVENTERLHHLVVCTLCSCYPRTLLGIPPDWYKSLPYRSRAVTDPRGVMKAFGLELPDSVEVRVLDSTADMRYLVVPRRPPGTDHLTEEELAQLVTRDSMIGVANPQYSAPAHA